MKRYEHMFSQLFQKKEGAFIPFVMLGDPDFETSEEILSTLIEAGADALELGVPFSDPVADGPVIQRAGMRALRAQMNWPRCAELLLRVREKNASIPIGILTYANIAMRFGLDSFYKKAKSVGVDSILLADVPTLECDTFVKAAKANDIAPILIVPPNASDEQLEKIAHSSQGYTYVVTRAGVTGADKSIAFNAKETIKKLRELRAPEPVFGFGISTEEHVKGALLEGASGAISGSAIVSMIERNLKDKTKMKQELHHFVSSMKAATRGNADQ